jgi:hypothetical protein
MMLVVCASIGWLFATAPAMGEDIALADADGAKHRILVATDAAPAEQYAARELAAALKEVTGQTFQIVHERPVDQPVIAVGAKASHSIIPELDLSHLSLGDEGIVMRTQGRDLVLSGAAGAPRGTLYAVYTFLEDVVGCRWWSPREQIIPKRPELSIAPLDERFIPPLEYRELHFVDAFDPAWAVKNKVNGHSQPISAEMGGHISYAGPFFVHTFGLLVPHKEHFEKHPEWFSEINGQRVAPPAATQLCLTNAELLEFVKGKVREIAAGVPKDTSAIISVSQDDNIARCQCAKCLAVEKEEGGAASGPIIRFVNAIADDIKDDYPRIAIDTLAYSYSNEPPTRTRPRDNVIVRLCTDHASYGQPLSDPANREFARQLKKWSNICHRVYIWDYVTNFHHYLLPHPNIHVLGPNVNFLLDNGVKGIFEQGNRHSIGGEFAILRQWFLAHKLWDPSRDDAELLEEFVNGYYQDAAPAVASYVERLNAAGSKEHVWMANSPLSPYLTADFLAESYDLISQARRQHDDKPEIAQRLEPIEASLLYGIVRSWPVRKQRSEMLGQDWPLERPYAHYAGELVRLCHEIGITYVSEGGTEGDLEKWFAQLQAYDGDSQQKLPDSLAAGRDRRDWIVLQDVEFSLAGQEKGWTARVPDEIASDGYAAEMPPTHVEWALVARTEGIDFPPSSRPGKWTVFAEVRVERTGKGADGGAFAYGVYDWDAKKHEIVNSTQVPLADTNADAYRLYRIGSFELNATSYVWMCPAINPAVKRMLIDRLIFVRGDVNHN